MPVSQLNVHTDELMSIASPGRREASGQDLIVLDMLSQQLGELVTESLTTETQYIPQGLRAATVLACGPSLRTVARSEEHTQTIAMEVFNNLHILSSMILNDRSLGAEAILKRDGWDVKKHTVGQWSEIGVLECIWWAIAHGLRDERGYAWPASRQLDSGYRRKDGLSLATDIVVFEPDRKEPIPVQVKTAEEDRSDYHPEIAFVVVSKLLEGELLRPRGLLNHLVRHNNDSNRRLGLINYSAIDEELSRARQARDEAKQGYALNRAVSTLKQVLGGRTG